MLDFDDAALCQKESQPVRTPALGIPNLRAMLFADNHVEYDATECHISLVASVAEDIGRRTTGIRFFLTTSTPAGKFY